MSADGRYLISGGRDSVVLIWDLGVIPSKSNNSSDKGKEKQKFNPKLVKTIPVLERVEALGVLSDASAEKLGSGETRLLFYTAGSKGIVRVWDAWEGQVVSSFGEETIQTSSDDEAQRGILDAS
jgi:U3 small nucleolar RNA-associated protein 13